MRTQIAPSTSRIFPGMKILQPLTNINGKITPEIILNMVAKYYGVRPGSVLNKRREASLVLCRFISYKLLRRHTRMSLNEIGEFFGRDHTSVMYGLSSLQNWIDTEDGTRNDFEQIEKLILDGQD